MNKRILLTAFIITCLFFSHQVFAKSLHFGIISAIEDKIDELREESTEIPKPEKLSYIKLYSDSSPFNQKIPADAEVDPNSDVMLQSLKDAFEEGEFYGAQKEWTVPVYFVDENTPRYDVKLTADWALARFLKDVPIPDFAEPDPEEDGEMAIIDTSTGCEYDFWQARKKSGKWSASWANAIPCEGDGIYPKGMSCRGAGFALLAGVIEKMLFLRGPVCNLIPIWI